MFLDDAATTGGGNGSSSSSSSYTLVFQTARLPPLGVKGCVLLVWCGVVRCVGRVAWPLFKTSRVLVLSFN